MPEKLIIATRHLPYGVVFTNGTRRISEEVPYRIHVSIWGKPERSRMVRSADIMQKQIKNYRGDRRAVFVLTITAQNIDEIADIAAICAENELALTFNHYSPTTKYIRFVAGDGTADKYHRLGNGNDNLVLQAEDLDRAHEIIARLIDDKANNTVIYNHQFNGRIHNHAGLYNDISPEGIAADCAVRLTSETRHYNTDLTRSEGKCCSPNVECHSCRLYAQSFATELRRSIRHMRQPAGEERLVNLWKLWCELFINDDRLRSGEWSNLSTNKQTGPQHEA